MTTYVIMGVLAVLSLCLTAISFLLDRDRKTFMSAFLGELSWIVGSFAIMIYSLTFDSLVMSIAVFIMGTVIMLVRPRYLIQMRMRMK